MSDDQVERALSRLADAPVSSWRDVPALGRRRRRRTRVGIAGGVVVAAGIAAAIVVPQLGTSGGGSAPPPPLAAGVTTGARIGGAVELVSRTTPLSSASSSAVSSVARSEQDFTAALLQQVAKGTDNVAVSPASLGIALSMLQNGAAGNTQTEILRALQASGVSATELDEGWAGLAAQWASAAKAAAISFSSANSLWQQRGLELRAPFLAALARYYASGVWQVDFAHNMSGALSAINQWTSQHTNGKIPKLFDSLDPQTLLVLANAVYFHAAWQTPFDPSQTAPGPFLSGSARTTVEFMTSPAPVATATTGTYDAAELPYAGGRFAALAIMPTSGSLTDFVAGLDGAKLGAIAGSLTESARVRLPRFTTTSTINLNPVLQAMGMQQAFGDAADFSPLSPTLMKVSQAIQRVYLKVGEKGTEAAAATGISMIPLSATADQPMTFDHPFLFLVRDTKTGAVLFASAINRPDPAS